MKIICSPFCIQHKNWWYISLPKSVLYAGRENLLPFFFKQCILFKYLHLTKICIMCRIQRIVSMFCIECRFWCMFTFIEFCTVCRAWNLKLTSSSYIVQNFMNYFIPRFCTVGNMNPMSEDFCSAQIWFQRPLPILLSMVAELHITLRNLSQSVSIMTRVFHCTAFEVMSYETCCMIAVGKAQKISRTTNLTTLWHL